MLMIIVTFALLAIGSAIMVCAWYLHLKWAHISVWQAVLMSWRIAFFEYCLQVPGNRIGHRLLSAGQLRIVSEFFTLLAFSVFSLWVLEESLTGNLVIGMTLVFFALLVVFFGPWTRPLAG